MGRSSSHVCRNQQPLVRKMLAAQPESVRQDLSQIKGTCGIRSQHEGSSWKKPTGLLSGGSPLKCQSLNHNPKLTEDRSELHSFASLFPGALPLGKTGLVPGFKVFHLLGHL